MLNSSTYVTKSISQLKTNNRDLLFSKSENFATLELLVELRSRKQHPIHIPTARETRQIYGSQYRLIPGSDLFGLVHSNGSPSWKKASWGTVRNGWVGLYAEYYNISSAEAVLQLAERFGIDKDKPLELTMNRTPFLIDGENHPLPEGGMEIDDITATHMETLKITFARHGVHCLLAVFRTPCGKVVHQPYYKAFADHSLDSRAYLWGFPSKDIPISELDVLECHLSATVILTDDAWLARQINQCLHTLGEPNHSGIVAMSFWAGSNRISKYSFAPLQGRKVVYMPTLHRDALAIGIELRDILRETGIDDFSVFMKPFASNATAIEAARAECGDYACENAVEFSRRNVLSLLDDIEHTWPFDRYKRFCQQEELIEIEPQIDEKPDPPLFLSAATINTIANTEGQQDIFSFSNVFDPSNITVIVGDSDAGKTMFTRTIAVAITTGTSAFRIRASDPRNVYIVNAEQDVHKSNNYTRRAMSSLEISEIPERLFDLPELSSTTPGGFNILDVLAPEWQELIIKQLTPNSILIIDNLLAASGKDLSHPSVARALRQFAKRLQERRIALIVIHHTGKNGKAMGSQALENLAQNFILMHRADSEEHPPGVNALVTFQKIKSCPLIKKKKFNAHLEYVSTLEEGSPWIFEEVGPAAIEAKPAPQKPDVGGLHEIQQAALLHAYEHAQVTRRDLVKKEHNEESVKKHLAKLVDGKLLISHGKGRGVYYTLKATELTN